MIRVALRQFRTEGIAGVALLLALGVVLLVTGLHLVDVNDSFHACLAAKTCIGEPNPVLTVDRPLQTAMPLLVIVGPALLGLFFGAPLIARELESGTFRLAWTQSVTRKHWLAAKVGLVGFVAVALGGLLTWMVDWWASPLRAVSQNRFGLASFGLQGVAPLGYAAFAFALGVTAGVLLRRTVAAMAVTGLGFAAARLAVTYWVRPNLIPPVHKTVSLLQGGGFSFDFGPSRGATISLVPQSLIFPNAWVYSASVANRAGQAPTSADVLRACPALAGMSKHLSAGPGGPPLTIVNNKHNLQACLVKLSATYHTVVTYQPPSRFWPLQWAEMGVFLAAALVLCAFSYWWIRRRYA